MFSNVKLNFKMGLFSSKKIWGLLTFQNCTFRFGHFYLDNDKMIFMIWYDIYDIWYDKSGTWFFVPAMEVPFLDPQYGDFHQKCPSWDLKKSNSSAGTKNPRPLL